MAIMAGPEGWRSRVARVAYSSSSLDEYLEASLPGIFAADSIACWPDWLTGDRILVVRWTVPNCPVSFQPVISRKSS